jgi:hypothetical protein
MGTLAVLFLVMFAAGAFMCRLTIYLSFVR